MVQQDRWTSWQFIVCALLLYCVELLNVIIIQGQEPQLSGSLIEAGICFMLIIFCGVMAIARAVKK